MQDLSNLQQEIYPSMPHRIPVSPQMQQHHHPQQVVTPPRLHYHPALLSPPPEVLSRSSSDSSLHQNLVQGKTVNNRKVSAPAEVRADPGAAINFFDTGRLGHELQSRPKSGCELTHPADINTLNHIPRSANKPIPPITNIGGAG
ncbi:uncharacterized protein, partial [Penaeus vannamei]